MLCKVLGLALDYDIFLLGRIPEAPLVSVCFYRSCAACLSPLLTRSYEATSALSSRDVSERPDAKQFLVLGSRKAETVLRNFMQWRVVSEKGPRRDRDLDQPKCLKSGPYCSSLEVKFWALGTGCSWRAS